MQNTSKVLFLLSFVIVSSLNARIPLLSSGVSHPHPIAGTPLQIQQAQQEAAKKPLTLEELANSQPSTEINLMDIQKARRALKAQKEAAELASQIEAMVGKQEEHAEKAIKSVDLTQEEDLIAKLDALKVDAAVKKDLKRMLKKQKNQNEEIITNQRIIIALLAVLAAKLVIYDSWVTLQQKTK